MINRIQEHHNEEDIQKLSMESEVLLMRDKLEFLNDEIEFYLNLLGSCPTGKTKHKYLDNNYLLERFKHLKNNNVFHMETCINFKNRLPGLEECDDVQCDDAYIQSHLLFKSRLEKHFHEIRNLKQLAFQYLNK